MSDEITNKADQPNKNERTEKVAELPAEEIAADDAQSVKGGRAPEYKSAKKRD